MQKFFYGSLGSVTIQVRCEGTEAQYWTLRAMEDTKCIGVHTSKSYAHIREMHGRYKSILQKS